MPGIGRPTQKNSFKDIAMAPKRANKRSSTNVGDELNRISGKRPESRFVDAAAHNKMGKDGFLKLLSHQLTNQDPLKPMDQKDFAADLAQFSQLEQLTTLNKKVTGLGTNAPSESKFYGASFLGKEITTNGTSVNYDGFSKNVDLPFYLPKAADKLMVRIFDSKRQMVQQLELEGLGRGQQNIQWDGISADGTPAVKGNYTIDVRGWDSQMSEFKGQTQSKGFVSGVHFDEKGQTVFTLKNDKQVYLKDVVSFKLAGQEKVAPGQNIPGLKKSAVKQYNNQQNNVH